MLHTAALMAKFSAGLCSPLPPYNTYIHIFIQSPPPPLRCCDSFVTKMNSSSAQQPKQVIWLPQPQIKLVWFNFRFGLLLQSYIKGDIFHYTAKTAEQGRPRWPTPSTGRHHGSIMAFTRYRCRSGQDGGSFGANRRACYPRGNAATHNSQHMQLVWGAASQKRQCAGRAWPHTSLLWDINAPSTMMSPTRTRTMNWRHFLF